VAGGPPDRGDAAHEGSANPENVYMHNERGFYRSSSTLLQHITDTATAVTDLAARLASQQTIGLDTEFLRERTYRAELCLIQVSSTNDATCIDPIAVADLAALAGPLTAAGVVKVMHASRQDLEVLLPVIGLVRPVFDTQIAAALGGFAAQVGYAELVQPLVERILERDQVPYVIQGVLDLLR